MKTVATFEYLPRLDSDFGFSYETKITVTFVHKARRLETIAFLDSGADITVLPYRIGARLGLILSEGNKIEFATATGNRFVLSVHQIGLKIGESDFAIVRIGWAQTDEVEMLIGRLDVFNHFTFEFNHNKQEIRVKQ
ncbi:MAG: hypothetical protein HY070_07165 [Chloroflexi bacterium]|nr:hypothetical protein [Chloroflexota bacterium]MBI3740320.1 hypothetical protein [Chloroflexota bacterium]